MTGDEELARSVKRDYRTASLDGATRALLDFAVDLTRDPATSEGEIERLRELGWTDPQILTAVEVVGFFNYYVRLAEGLGVDPEDEMERDPGVWPE